MENAEALVVATKEIGLEVNADKTKYMVTSRDWNAGRGHRVKIDNSSIERVEEFKYLGTSMTATLHKDLYTFWIISCSILFWNEKCFRQKAWRKQKHNFIF